MANKKGYGLAVIILSIIFAVVVVCQLLIIPPEAVDAHGNAGCTLYIPTKGSATAYVDLNTANQIFLSTIPGISNYAEDIISMRQQLGEFSSVEQLMLIKGIGFKTFLSIAPYVKCDNEYSAQSAENTR